MDRRNDFLKTFVSELQISTRKITRASHYEKECRISPLIRKSIHLPIGWSSSS